MKITPFDGEGHWYKGNLHSHTNTSDGAWTVEEVVREYKNHGYSFLAISDHDVYGDYRDLYDTHDFITLPAIEGEVSLWDNDNSCIKLHHMNGILGTKKMQEEAPLGVYPHLHNLNIPSCYNKWNGKNEGIALARDLKLHGCFVTYNHPLWSRVCIDEVVDNPNIDIVEIFNYNTVNECGLGYDTFFWDQMLSSGKRVFADASDDNHNAGTFDDSFGGYIMVYAPKLSHDDIVTSILEGRYYSTSGPSIEEFYVDGRNVHVKCSPVERIDFIVGGSVGRGRTVISKEAEEICEADFEINAKDKYIRVECVDNKGRRAWSNPIFLKAEGKK